MPTDLHASRYTLGFTGASLRPELTRIIAEDYLLTSDWAETRRRVLDNNSLQARTRKSASRLEGELRQRLETLTRPQLELLAGGNADDAAALSWLAACKYVPFLFEFAAEVLRDKLAGHDATLRPSDYEAYAEHKALLHPELVRLKEGSRQKLREVLLRMLHQAGVLVRGGDLGIIQRPVLSPAVTRAIASDNPRWLACFLVPDSEIAEL